ncbi:PQQ-binding-like beta-propeller repeat protein [Myxococcus sp. CA051A]|uniref:outer membrane protein assembly factor BamB family protein n=2 Tax=Myxococcus TaxID=32 RepID=UPI00157B87F4|nr:PQQ-binding-like beta-propeller repeat protein [Myxococcus sp. CA056]NTX04833.1 PQQ-binding-like beta-propeller repeat protein [Myxococcus sp. CA040A]NTX15178.1 PQQ-binding-like beta-propeller repeat protein [Myxococcus sp. CA056]NTX63907.1 PQQ-binding-like beta-propeller repeat protein [Myxococcus sp. CA051A]
MSPRACPCRHLALALTLTLVTAMGCREPAETVFRYSTDASSRAGLTPLPDGVLTGNEAGAVVRLDRTGALVWRVALGREVATRPVVAGDSVIVGTVAGDLVRLALADGAERWRLTGEPPVLTPLVPAPDGASVYVVAPDGAVRSLAVDTGKVRWKTPAPKPDEAHLDAGRGLPSPVLVDGRLVVALGDVGLVALSTADGARVWRQEVRGVLGLEVRGEALFASTRDKRVWALRTQDGAPLWEQSPAKDLTSPPSLALGLLWVGARVEDAPVLVGLSPEDGKEVARVGLPDVLTTHVAEAPGDVLLVPTHGRQGRLLALKQPTWERAFSLRTDTALRSRPVVLGEQVFVLGQDGRVLSWKLRPPEPERRP